MLGLGVWLVSECGAIARFGMVAVGGVVVVFFVLCKEWCKGVGWEDVVDVVGRHSVTQISGDIHTCMVVIWLDECCAGEVRVVDE